MCTIQILSTISDLLNHSYPISVVFPQVKVLLLVYSLN